MLALIIAFILLTLSVIIITFFKNKFSSKQTTKNLQKPTNYYNVKEYLKAKQICEEEINIEINKFKKSLYTNSCVYNNKEELYEYLFKEILENETINIYKKLKVTQAMVAVNSNDNDAENLLSLSKLRSDTEDIVCLNENENYVFKKIQNSYILYSHYKDIIEVEGKKISQILSKTHTVYLIL